MKFQKIAFCGLAVLATLAAHSTPPPQAGMGMVWGNDDKILQLPYVHFGQGYDQWNLVEPVEGQYDWNRIDAKLEHYAEMDKRVPVQINSPCPEWIFNYVACTGTARKGKSPQLGENCEILRCAVVVDQSVQP